MQPRAIPKILVGHGLRTIHNFALNYLTPLAQRRDDRSAKAFLPPESPPNAASETNRLSLKPGFLVRVVGLEPTFREEEVFETSASTIPPHPQARNRLSRSPRPVNRPLTPVGAETAEI